MSSSKTKKALIGSAGALVLCFALLLGTTFAWFTDNASTKVNKIQAGNLDVALEMADGTNDDGTTKWVSAEGKTLNFIDLDANDLWEPGCTYYTDNLRISNKGDLALKFKVEVTGLDGDAKLNEVIEWGLLSSRDNENYDPNDELSSPYTRNWKNIEDEECCSPLSDEFYLLPGECVYMQPIAWMDENAGNDYQGLSIDGISITVLATQYTHEYDSESNTYDADANYMVEVSDIYSLRQAIEQGKDVKLMADIEIGNDDLEIVDTAKNAKGVLRVTKDTLIDLNGKTLAYTGGTNNACWYVFYVKNATLTIIDSSGDNSGTVFGNDPDGTWAVMIRESTGGTVNIYGGHYKSEDGAPVYTNDGTVNIYGGIFETAGHENQLLYMGNYTGSINVYGGTFKNYNPSSDAVRNIKLADGCVVESSVDGGNTWYTVS